ncbi:glycosyl transferase family 1 [Chitinispirillum alkaliphilum]|nr:glycosyl transferase family 1 [Chitinispirillum alkaliphilum]
MKIALLSETYQPLNGGVEQAVKQLALHIPSQFDVTVFAHLFEFVPHSLFVKYSCRQRYRKSFQSSSDVSVTEIHPTFLSKLLLLPLLVWQMPLIKKLNAPKLFDILYFFYRLAYRTQFRQFIRNYDIVHCFSTGYVARLAAHICREENIPLIQSPYIHFEKWGDSPKQMEAYCSGEVVICHSQEYRMKLLRHYSCKARTEIIPPVISDPVVLDTKKEGIDGEYFLFLGRREPHKGLLELLEAFGNTQTSVKLVIAGPGKPVHDSSGRVIDLGVVDESTKAQLFQKCLFLCVPSREETFGIVFTEAMSYGKPVLSLDIPPINEIVENGKSGILTPVNDKESLKRALLRLISDSRLRDRLGQNALLRFKTEFSSRVTMKKILSLYQELADS